MAHAVSGSAYSAKGGNLKFADVVRERFRGPAFGQDFTTWLDEVLLGFETANISESSQVTHLVAFLESPNREIPTSGRAPARSGDRSRSSHGPHEEAEVHGAPGVSHRHSREHGDGERSNALDDDRVGRTLPAFRLGDGPSKAPHRQTEQAHRRNPICSIPGEGGCWVLCHGFASNSRRVCCGRVNNGR